MTASGIRRKFISSFVCGESFATPSMRSQALGGAHLSSLSEHESRAHQLVPAWDHSAWTVPLVSFDPASSDQRDGARESAHQTRARPQGSRDGLATTDKTGTPNDRGTTRGFLLRRARPSVPRALGASWSPPRATSRTRLRHRRSDQPCGRSLIVSRTASGSA
jgi:hypothetical protein